jgi:hypothetical protein
VGCGNALSPVFLSGPIGRLQSCWQSVGQAATTNGTVEAASLFLPHRSARLMFIE